MKSKIIFLCFAVVLVAVNISQNFQSNSGDIKMNQLLNVAIADGEGGGSGCTTGAIYGGQLFPCQSNPSIQEGETWATFWCDGTPPGSCLTGGYSWVYSCSGTAVGVSEQHLEYCQ